MKVLLANIPWYKYGRSGVRAGSRWPHIKDHCEGAYLPFPFFLAYAAALLKKNNFHVRLVDAIAEGLSENEFLESLANFAPDLLLIETSTVSLEDDLAFIEKIDRQIPIVLCGPDTNIASKEFLEENKRIGYVIRGEYEYSLLDLAAGIRGRRDLKDIRGINFRLGSQEIRVNPARPLIDNLSDLPWPLREGLPMQRYLDTPGGLPLPSAQMLASRGCPYSCIFCLWPQVMYGGRNYRVRNPKDVVDEMEHLVRRMRFRSVYFDDDTFGLDRQWLGEFARELKGRRLGAPWAMMARADCLDAAILKELKAAGLFAVKYGAESAAQDIIDRCGKNLDLARAEKGVKDTKALGIKVHLTFMFGLPGETRETVKKTIDFALRLNPNSLQFSVATPFPGTIFFDQLKKQGLLTPADWSDYDGNHNAVFNTPQLSAKELKQARDKAYFLWGEHCRRRGDFTLRSLMHKLFLNLKIAGLGYTAKKIFQFMRRVLERFSLALELAHHRYKTRIKDRLRNYMNMMGVISGSHAYLGPYMAQIDLTNKCNNNCIACWCNSPLLDEGHIDPLEKSQTLGYALVKELIDELYSMYTRDIYIAGGGEPFMHPDIMEIVRHIKKRKLVCHINTNFTLVDKARARQLVECGVDHLTVSLWAGSPAVYALTHPNKDEQAFLKIKKVLKYLTSLRQKGRPPFVKLYNVIFNLNYADVEQMIEFAWETGVDSVEFAVIDTVPGKTDCLLLSEEQRRVLVEKCHNIREKFRDPAANNGLVLFQFDQFVRRVSHSYASSGEYDKDVIDSLRCYAGWVFTRIMANGNVNACLKAHRIPAGNIHKQRFRDIWNGDSQKQFRRKTGRPKKDDPFFSLIGNDPNVAVGCYKGCDDMGRNYHNHNIFLSLSAIERMALSCGAKALGERIITRGVNGDSI
jgi:radical SAM superfamily enzyme YgiQ (UPF0313 family)/MoaA/NifB/PqqE/SkfB family radical SAM enzyme